LQASEIRVLAPQRRPVELRGLPVYPALFFVTLFLLTSFLTIPLGLGGFTYSCDDALLSDTMYRCQRPTTTRPPACDSPSPWVAIGDARLSDQSGTGYPNSIPNWQRM
jgi:hypothetical protein